MVEQYKMYMKYSKTKIINKDNNLVIDISKTDNNNISSNLNISCPNNPCYNNNGKNSLNNETRNTNNKISYINVDLSNLYMEKEKGNEKENIKSKKTIDCIDNISNKISNSNLVIKRINISNYNNLNELENDIFKYFE